MTPEEHKKFYGSNMSVNCHEYKAGYKAGLSKHEQLLAKLSKWFGNKLVQESLTDLFTESVRIDIDELTELHQEIESIIASF